MTGQCRAREGYCRREGFPDEGRLLVERSQTRMKRHCIHLAKRRSGWNAKGSRETTVEDRATSGVLAWGVQSCCTIRPQREGRTGALWRRWASEDGGAGTEAEWVPEGGDVGEGHSPASLVPWRKAGQRSKPLLKVLD